MSRKRLDNLRDLLAGADAYIATLVLSGNLQGAISLSQRIQSIYEQAGSGNAPAAEKENERSEDVGMADAVCFLPLRILVTYRSGLEHRTPELTKERIKRLRWHEAASLYTNGFVREELRQLNGCYPA